MAGYAIQVRLNEAQCERLDAWRRAHTDPPSRAKAANALLDEALNTFIEDALVEQSRARPSFPPARRGRPPKRSGQVEASA